MPKQTQAKTFADLVPGDIVVTMGGPRTVTRVVLGLDMVTIWSMPTGGHARRTVREVRTHGAAVRVEI